MILWFCNIPLAFAGVCEDRLLACPGERSGRLSQAGGRHGVLCAAGMAG